MSPIECPPLLPWRDGSLGSADPGSHGGSLELAGVLTHAGHAYACRNREEVVAVATQEHGVVSGPPYTIGRFRVGDRLRIVPNHSCLAAACFDRYHVVEGQAVVDEWRPVRSW
ncbi:MAG: hypothetical protein KA072_09280 [Thermoanaerobaculaceae bacterium]|nr:hypothetical protein [Thermoanaerobaculaceae bacterium]MDI9622102.1 hypothetical protein [Acidobacteriota bacterium]NLH11612.1 hypothetical protein [Holophagae bacterium]HPW56655.1 hypothetical protein [Thermoanaerobaculaceae bacterium]